MKKIIKRKIYDTDTSKQLAFKNIGEFGEPNGYEERLYITKRGLYFIFGQGGPESPYPEPDIKAAAKEDADKWGYETTEDKKTTEKKTRKPKNAVEAKKDTKAKKPRKPAAKKPAKDVTTTKDVKNAEPAEETATVKDAK